MDYILACIPNNSNNILSDTLNQCYKHVRLVMKYPNLLKIPDENNCVTNLIEYPSGNAYRMGLLNNGNIFGYRTEILRQGDILAALSFPENQDGDIITIRTDDHILNTIVIDKKKTFYPPVRNGIMLHLNCILYQHIYVYGAKKIQTLFIYFEGNIRVALAFNQQYFEYCEEIYHISSGVIEKIEKSNIRNGTALDYNKIWAANKIGSFYKFIIKKRKIKEKLKKIESNKSK